MFAGRVPSRYRIKRHARRLGLRGLRVVRRHYFSLVSACVLGVALYLALTSNALPGENVSAVQPISAAPASAPTSTPGVMPLVLPTQPPLSRLLVYYVVGSQAQRDEIEAALEADASFRARVANLGGAGVTFHYFLTVQSLDDQKEAHALVNELAIQAPTQGYRLHVVDLR